MSILFIHLGISKDVIMASSICENERKNLEWLQRFQLHPQFWRIGMIAFFVVFGLMVLFNIVLDFHNENLRQVMRYGLLVSLLMMSLARDAEEDERTNFLRTQSYRLALIIGVLYAVFMPFVEGAINLYFEKFESLTIEDLGAFQTLLFVLFIQIMFYHQSKRWA